MTMCMYLGVTCGVSLSWPRLPYWEGQAWPSRELKGYGLTSVLWTLGRMFSEYHKDSLRYKTIECGV